MCFQYKWLRSRKEKIKGKGQTKQIKLASLLDFSVNYCGFGKDPRISFSKFFSQGISISPREETLASKSKRNFKTGLLQTEVTGSRSGMLAWGTHRYTFNPQGTHFWGIHQRHQDSSSTPSSCYFQWLILWPSGQQLSEGNSSPSEMQSNLTKRLFKRHAFQSRQNKLRCVAEWGQFGYWNQS